MKQFDNYLEGMGKDPLTFKKSDPIGYEIAEREWKSEELANVSLEEIADQILEGSITGKVGNVMWYCNIEETDYDSEELANEVKQGNTSGQLLIGGNFEFEFWID